MSTPEISKESWLGKPVEIRMRYMSSEFFVPHPDFVRLVNEISRMSLRCQNERTGHAFLVLAGSGSGKTYLSRYIHRAKPEDHSDVVSHVPVVTFSIPSSPTQKTLGAALLLSLHDPKYKSGSAHDLFERAIKQLATVRTEIIFIDNVHDIPERRRTGGVMQLGNWIRDLIDRSGCLVVLLGTPAARQVTDANAQLRRRVIKQISMSYFGMETTEDTSRFLRLLLEVDKRLPLAHLSNLRDPDIAKRMFFASYGVAAIIIQLLMEAVSIAVKTGRERLERKDFAAAFILVFSDSAKSCNPFAEDGPARLIDREGEPFHNWFDKSNPHH